MDRSEKESRYSDLRFPKLVLAVAGARGGVVASTGMHWRYLLRWFFTSLEVQSPAEGFMLKANSVNEKEARRKLYQNVIAKFQRVEFVFGWIGARLAHLFSLCSSPTITLFPAANCDSVYI